MPILQSHFQRIMIVILLMPPDKQFHPRPILIPTCHRGYWTPTTYSDRVETCKLPHLIQLHMEVVDLPVVWGTNKVAWADLWQASEEMG